MTIMFGCHVDLQEEESVEDVLLQAAAKVHLQCLESGE